MSQFVQNFFTIGLLIYGIAILQAHVVSGKRARLGGWHCDIHTAREAREGRENGGGYKRLRK
jgi:hypothetical protein